VSTTDSCTATKKILNYLVGERERFIRNGKAERHCGCEVDDEFKFHWLLDWHVSRLLALEDAVHIAGRAPEPRNSTRLTTDHARTSLNF
jgi:hypothetical protein